MNCLMCTYFYVNKKSEPCVNCINKSNFKLWIGNEKEIKNFPKNS